MKIKKYVLAAAALFGAALPLNIKAANVFLCLFMILAIVFIILEKQKFKKPSWKLLCCSTLFIILLIGIGAFENPSGFIKYIGRYITYLILPILFIQFKAEDLKEILNRGISGLAIGLLVAIFVLTYFNLSSYFTSKGGFVIDASLLDFYHTHFNYTAPLNIHPVYLGMYTMLGIIFLWDKMLYKNLKRPEFLLCIVGVVIFTINIIFLNARIIHGVLLACFVVYFGRWFIKTNIKYKITALVSIALLAFGGFKMIKNTYIYDRLTTELVWELTNQVNTKYNYFNNSDSRMARWIVTSEVIAEKPIFGWGTGVEKEVLGKAFRAKNLNAAADEKYDAHNQFLSFGVEFGFVGLVLFLCYLIASFVCAYKNDKNLFSICFFILILIVSTTENIFKNNSGILFIVFFGNIITIKNILYAKRIQ